MLCPVICLPVYSHVHSGTPNSSPNTNTNTNTKPARRSPRTLLASPGEEGGDMSPCNQGSHAAARICLLDHFGQIIRLNPSFGIVQPPKSQNVVVPYCKCTRGDRHQLSTSRTRLSYQSGFPRLVLECWWREGRTLRAHKDVLIVTCKLLTGKSKRGFNDL